jgi:type II secretory pathway pseudopilin PulG
VHRLQRERGSTLVSVMLLVLITTIFATALLMVSAQATQASARQLQETQALADARTGILAAYQQIRLGWNEIQQKRNPQTADEAMECLQDLATALQRWAERNNNGLPANVQVKFPDTKLYSVDPTSTTPGSVGMNITIKSTATRGSVSETLQSSTSISGLLDGFRYALYTPGDLVVAGSPQVDGEVAVQNRVYVSPTPWVPNYDPVYPGSAVLGVPSLFQDIADLSMVRPLFDIPIIGSVLQDLLSQVVTSDVLFVPDPDAQPMPGSGGPPLPTFNGSVLYAGKGLYQFTGFNDQSSSSSYTAQFFNSSAAQYSEVGLSDAGTVLRGTARITSTGGPRFSADATSIGDIVERKESQLQNENDVIRRNGDCSIAVGQTEWSKPTFVNGDLVVWPGATLIVDQPIFVNGDLIVQGTLVANATIYVHGGTYYEPYDLFQPRSGSLSLMDPRGSAPPRLEIVSDGPIVLTLKNTGLSNLPSSPVTMHAFLASASTVLVDGTTGYFHIEGGIIGNPVWITGVSGRQQISVPAGFAPPTYLGRPLWPLWKLRNMDPSSDNSPRLVIDYDPSYLTNPVIGTPTLSNLTVQPLSPPQRVTG